MWECKSDSNTCSVVGALTKVGMHSHAEHGNEQFLKSSSKIKEYLKPDDIGWDLVGACYFFEFFQGLIR